MNRIRVNSQGFARDFVLRRFQRQFVEFLEAIPDKELVWMAQNNRNIADLIDKSLLTHYAQIAKRYKDIIDEVTPDMLWHWIPDRQIAVLAGIPGSREWATRQIESIKGILSGAIL